VIYAKRPFAGPKVGDDEGDARASLAPLPE
jgi:hypothetical protein